MSVAALERIKPAEVARRLQIGKSSVSRYLGQYPELIGTDGCVDWTEFQKHRGDNWRVGEPRPGESASAPTARSTGRKGIKQRLEEIRLEQAEIELARQKGEVVDARDVGDAVMEAASTLRDALMDPDQAFCDRLAAERDPRVCAQLVRDRERSLMEKFVASLSAIDGKPQDGGNT
ncbi:MAG: hypothetical protein ISS15_05405 [Alphaproteobacteria bacterium]|nr:hypothetical protein [Alphaproteobacteria bacterium]MBL6939443.1 hypothetical protein [Alphaproteobacteria bacterium]MBL7097076.1 hypothetical protein [Alphaproteobacteria bacterium]